MARKLTPFAIAYDFDGTLAPGNMQEYDFVPRIGMTPSEFWKEVSEKAKKIEGDNILVYMCLMLEKAKQHSVAVRREDFEHFGRGVELFEGVQGWFDRIDVYGKTKGIKISHFIVSSGIREMIAGTPIAKKFSKIFASAFWYDHHGVAHWPALALNYTTKTQYLFRINKGVLDVWNHAAVNEYVAHDKRAVPFTNMVFIGDGETDIPCFRLVKDMGGHAIAVYKPSARGAKERALKLVKEGRVHFTAPAAYTDGSAIDKQVKAIIDRVAAEAELKKVGKNH